jgi:hypothetical protein
MEEEKREHTTGWAYDFDEEYGENNEFVEEVPVLTREEQEAQVKQTLLDLYVGIAVGAVLVLIIGNLILKGDLQFTLGALAGVTTAVCLAGYMYHSVLVATEYPEKQAAGYMKRSSAIRMVIMIAVIGASVFFLGKHGLFGTVLGTLSLKLSALFWPVIHKYNPLTRVK